MNAYHIPVLLKESLEGLKVRPEGIYVDATYGGGGYSGEILKKIDSGRLFSIDMDKEAVEDLPRSDKFIFIPGNFRYIRNYLKYYGIREVDGIVADLGVSSRHFDETARGFTYRSAAPLDMRMNPAGRLTAEKIVNHYDQDGLTKIFREYGELKEAAKIARLIMEVRTEKRIVTNMQLIEAIKAFVPKKTENQFLSRVFQAIRIEVNHELDNLRVFLASAGELLKSGGRLVIVSYHSLEDRMVKNFLRWGNMEGPPQKDFYGHQPEYFHILTKKPITPTPEEIAQNSRARSARLRIAVKY